jgi:hypothetical protein
MKINSIRRVATILLFLRMASIFDARADRHFTKKVLKAEGTVLLQ